EIAGRYGVQPEEGVRFFGGGNIVFHIRISLLKASVETQSVDQRGFVHAGEGTNFAQQIAIERKAASLVGAEILIGCDAGGQDVVGMKSGVAVRERPQATDKQPRAADE